MSEEYKAPTDWRALCEELADALACHYPGHVDDDELASRARAALAEPVGEGPTDEELLETMSWIGQAAARAIDEQMPAAVEPIALAERKPGLEDCDAEGRCWWFCLECPGEHSYWILAKEVYCEPTYWLPATALPLPL